MIAFEKLFTLLLIKLNYRKATRVEIRALAVNTVFEQQSLNCVTCCMSLHLVITRGTSVLSVPPQRAVTPDKS